MLRGRKGIEFAEGFDEYLKYKSTDHDDVWIILRKPTGGTRTVGEGPRQHEVCVVGTDDRGDERPARLDGSGITFKDGVPGMVQSSLKRLHQNLGHPRGEDLQYVVTYGWLDASPM